MSDVPKTIAEAAAALMRGQVTSETLTDACLTKIAASELNAWTALRPREALLADAREADARRRAGGAHPLLGIPIGIKANIATPGLPTGCASQILDGYHSPFESTASERLRAAGAVVLGTTNMDEFGMGGTSEHSVHGPVRNPHDPAHVPGGSSGGSAAAVAAGECLAALGSDTGGSIRQPAAWCGVVGVKPTYGRVSRWGLVAFASSLDQVGPIAPTVADAATVLQAIAGHDPRDATSLDSPVASLDPTSTERSSMVVGVPRALLDDDGLNPEVRDAIERTIAVAERHGAQLREIELPHLRYAVATYYLVATAEASSNLARYDGLRYGARVSPDGADLRSTLCATRGRGFGAEVKRRILLGTYVLSSGYAARYYERARRARTCLAADYAAAFESGCDVIALPTAPTPPPRLGELLDDPLAMYLADVFTVGPSLAGLPALSLPCGQDGDGLPIGLQLVAPRLAEADLIACAATFERILTSVGGEP